MTKMITLTIDDHSITVPEGFSILNACEKLAIEVPTFCYHPRLAVAGNCRMCLVEVEKMPKPVASCAMPVAEGMVVKTKSTLVTKARKGVLEFLLINHPLDCPICDQGGECDLQDLTIHYGKGSSRFHLNKRIVPQKHMGPLIKTMMNRCIHCTRCVRFATEVAGCQEIGAIYRGEHTEITTLEQAITSELSGNLVDVCPVGALTFKPTAFHFRSWELQKTDSIDVLDAVGSAIRIDSRDGKVMRIMPRINDAINEEWISDRTRFACDGLGTQRLDTPYVKKDNKLTAVSWKDALDEAAKALRMAPSPLHIAGLVGNLADVESVYVLKMLLDLLKTPHQDCRQDGANYHETKRSDYLFNTSIQGIEDADFILLVGTNPRHEATLVNARIQKAVRKGATIALIGNAVDLTYPYLHLGDSPAALAMFLNDQHAKNQEIIQKLASSQKPMMILGHACFTHPDSDSIVHAAKAIMQKYPAFIQRSMSENDESLCTWYGYNVLHHVASRVGALDVGFLPGKDGLAFDEILKGCQTGDISVVIAYGVDEIPAQNFKNTYVIYIGHHGDQGAHLADIILPSAAYSEKMAHYINTEGRVQSTQKAVPPPGLAQEDWSIITALAHTCGLSLPFQSHKDILAHLYQTHPHLEKKNHVTPLFLKDITKDFDSIKASKIEAAVKSFTHVVPNYYMTCPITRHSKTMADCVTEILNKSEEGMACCG